jgi:hypothetical protein
MGLRPEEHWLRWYLQKLYVYGGVLALYDIFAFADTFRDVATLPLVFPSAPHSPFSTADCCSHCSGESRHAIPNYQVFLRGDDVARDNRDNRDNREQEKQLTLRQHDSICVLR